MMNDPWLNAYSDPLSSLKTINSCIRVTDLSADGDSRLIIAGLDKTLKVYRGTSLVSEHALLDQPVALCITYTENTVPRIPSIAVAAGSHIFIYRQLRPYRKWSCPKVDIVQAEIDIWNDLSNNTINISAGIKLLSDIRDRGMRISSRSAELLSLDLDEQRIQFVEDMKNLPFVQHTLITCMETIKKDQEDIDAINALIVGTELGQVLCLPHDPVNSEFIWKVELPSPPVLFNIAGVLEGEYRINVICRDAKLYTIKNGDTRGTAVVTGIVTSLGSHALAAVRIDKSLWVATMDRLISSYTIKGKRINSITLDEDITDMCAFTIKKTKLNELLLVALASGEIRLYRGIQVIHSFFVQKPVIAMRFGPYGREDNSLIVIHGRGSLMIKIWRRTADVDAAINVIGAPPEQDIPLQVPKKTKLYVEQTERERNFAPEMHRTFQRDLSRLRLETARAYVKTLTDVNISSTPIGIVAGAPEIRINVQVQGLGPIFLLKVTLQNLGNFPVMQSMLVFSFDSELYIMGHNNKSKQIIQIPLLLTGPKHDFETEIQSIDPQGKSGQLLIYIYNNSYSVSAPIISASVKMPVSELLF